jgi:hypothetical protein
MNGIDYQLVAACLAGVVVFGAGFMAGAANVIRSQRREMSNHARVGHLVIDDLTYRLVNITGHDKR